MGDVQATCPPHAGPHNEASRHRSRGPVRKLDVRAATRDLTNASNLRLPEAAATARASLRRRRAGPADLRETYRACRSELRNLATLPGRGGIKTRRETHDGSGAGNIGAIAVPSWIRAPYSSRTPQCSASRPPSTR